MARGELAAARDMLKKEFFVWFYRSRISVSPPVLRFGGVIPSAGDQKYLMIESHSSSVFVADIIHPDPENRNGQHSVSPRSTR